MTKLQRIYAAALHASDLMAEFRAVFGKEPDIVFRSLIVDQCAPAGADAHDKRRIAFLAARMADVSV